MKRLLFAGLVGLSLCSTASAATQIQSVVAEVMNIFKFEFVPTLENGQQVIGVTQCFKVTKETIKTLQKHLDDVDEITIDGDGKVEVKKAKKSK